MEESLGRTLRSAREASGLTVDDAVYRAKLPRAVVEALEADDFGFFSSPLYARSFLRQYGEYIGADVGPWIDDLVPTALIESETLEAFIDLTAPEPAPKAREKEKPRKTGGGAMAAVWMILITGGLVWGGIEIFRHYETKTTPPLQAPGPQQAAATPAPPEEPLAESPEKKPAAPSPPAEPEPPQRAIIVEVPEE